MKELTYAAATDAAGRGRGRAPPTRDAVFLGGGTNLVDHLKLGVATPRHAGRRQPAAARRRSRSSTRRPGCASAPNVRNSDLAAHPRRARALPGRRPRPAGRRLRPDPQPGHHRRQPAPAHPLRLLPGRHHPVQQARARQRLLGARGLRPLQRDPRRQRGLRGHAPLRPRRRAGRASTPWWSSSAPTASAGCRSPTCTACPATTPSATPSLAHGELITAVELPAAGARAGARPTSRRATGRPTPSRWSRWPRALDLDRRRHVRRRADRLGRGRPQAVARRRVAEDALRGQPARPRTPSARPSTTSWRDAAPAADNAYKLRDGARRHRAGA